MALILLLHMLYYFITDSNVSPVMINNANIIVSLLQSTTRHMLHNKYSFIILACLKGANCIKRLKNSKTSRRSVLKSTRKFEVVSGDGSARPLKHLRPRALTRESIKFDSILFDCRVNGSRVITGVAGRVAFRSGTF